MVYFIILFYCYLKDWFSSIFTEKVHYVFSSLKKKKGHFRVKPTIALKGREGGSQPISPEYWGIFRLHLEERSMADYTPIDYVCYLKWKGFWGNRVKITFLCTLIKQLKTTYIALILKKQSVNKYALIQYASISKIKGYLYMPNIYYTDVFCFSQNCMYMYV